jgi:hypothetical protein
MPRKKHNRRPHRTSGSWWRPALSMIGSAVLLFVFVALLGQPSTTSSVHAQHHAHSDHSPGHTVQPLLDGAEDVNLIPDEVAIRVLMQTLRVPSNAHDADLRQLRVRIGRAGLSAADLDILALELGAFDAWVGDQQARIEALRPDSENHSHAAISRYVSAQEDFGALIVDSYHRLRASLSPDGAMRMQDHLQHVKSRIRIHQSPDMTAGRH